MKPRLDWRHRGRIKPSDTVCEVGSVRAGFGVSWVSCQVVAYLIPSVPDDTARIARTASWQGTPHSLAAAEGLRIFRMYVQAVAEASRLQTDDERAVSVVRACCVGLVLTLIDEIKTDAGDLSRATREAVLAAIATDAADVAPMTQQTAAAALRTTLDQPAFLSRGERALLDELLERLSKQRS